MGVRRAVKSGNPYHDPLNGRFTNKPGGGRFGGSSAREGYASSGRALAELDDAMRLQDSRRAAEVSKIVNGRRAAGAAPAKGGGRHRMPEGRVGKHRAEPIPFSQKASDFGKERLSDGFDFLYNMSAAPIPGVTA